MISRRDVLTKIGAAAGVAAFSPRMGYAQAPRSARSGAARSAERYLESAARFFGAGHLSGSRHHHASIRRSMRCASATRRFSGCGPAACGARARRGTGRASILIWSDIPNNRQLRWLQDDGHVTVFRQPSGNSNGNTFDHQGRQLSCEHSGRRVVRYEHDGSVTVIADSYQGKRLNSPNDIACHHRRQLLVQRSAVWRTDCTKGCPMRPGGPSNKQGRSTRRSGSRRDRAC